MPKDQALDFSAFRLTLPPVRRWNWMPQSRDATPPAPALTVPFGHNTGSL